MERVIAYVDGFNLYFGLRDKGWKWFYWLNVQAMIQRLLKPQQALVRTKYFTAVVNYPEDKRRRQTDFLDALQTLPDFHIYYGHYLSNIVKCRQCGHTYTAYHEKRTDVNIAVELLCDAFHDEFDTALLVTADSDLSSPIESVRSLFSSKRVVVAFPPARSSAELRRVAHGVTNVGRNVLAQSVLPDQVVRADGVILQRPPRWR
ncbi:MAG: NYN domain-containing protein [Anaerolineales bacterium]